MRTFLYLIWFTIPGIFLIMALYTQLEVWSGKAKRRESGASFKQGMFVLACSVISYVIDQFWLEDLVNSFLDPVIPLLLAQIVLFPLVLLLLAKLVGGTKPLQIQSKRTNSSNRRKR